MRKRYILLFIILWTTLVAAAQQSLCGIVSDASGKPIVSASVTTYADSACKKLKAYTFTQKDGSFDVKADSFPLWIKVQMIGYKPQFRQLDKGVAKLHFTLTNDNRTLGEVIVKGRYNGVNVSGDTIRFNTDYFRNGSEETLADILRKLPSVEVSEDGEVTVSGKKVDKLLFDGRDLFTKENSGMIVKNLSASHVKGAEVWRNYQEEKVDSAFHEQKKLALNVKTTGIKKVTGTLEAGGGVLNRFSASGSLIGFSERLALTAYAKGNNTGESLMSVNDFSNYVMGMAGMPNQGIGINTVTITGAEHMLIWPSEYVTKNIGGTGAFTLRKELGKTGRLLGSVLYADQNIDEERVSEETYFANSAKRKRTVKNNSRTRLFNVKLNEFWKPSDHAEINGLTRFYLVRNTPNGLTSSEGNGDNLHAREALRITQYDISQQFDAKYVKGKHFFYAKGQIGADANEADLTVQTDTLLLPRQYQQDDNQELWALIPNTTTDHHFTVNPEIGYSLQFGKGYVFNASATYGYDQFTREYAELRQYDKEKARLHTGLANFNIIKRQGNLTGFVEAKLFASHYQYGAGYGSGKLFRVLPNVQLTYQIKQLHTFQLSYTEQYDRMPLGFFMHYERVTGYNSLERETFGGAPYMRKQVAGFFYSYSDMVHLHTLTASVNYVRQPDAFIPTVEDNGGYVIFSNKRQGTLESLQSSLRYEHSFKLGVPFTFVVSGATSQSESPSLVNGVLNNAKTVAVAGDVSLTTKCRTPFNVGAVAHYQWLRNRIRVASIQEIQRDWYAGGNLSYAKGKWVAWAQAIYRKVKTGLFDYGYCDLEMNLKYNLKNCSLRLEGKNLLYLKGVRFASVSSNAYYSASTIYRKLPGHLMLSLSWRF